MHNTRFRAGPACHRATLLLIVLMAIWLAPAARAAAPTAVVGSGTPASCTEAELAAALALGGTISFSCGTSPATITITSEKLVTSDTTIDGGGLITLRGSGSTPILRSVDGTFTGSAVTKVIKLTIAGLTIENGLTSDQGGGIKVGFWNDFTLRDSTLRGNRSTKDDENCAGGGAIFIGGGGSARIERSIFADNQANNGGAINSLRSNLVIINSTFSANRATHSSRINQFADCGGGGAVYIDGARGPTSGGPAPTLIQGSLFSGNSTNNHGGGLFVGLYANESIAIDHTTFDGNSVSKAATKDSSGTGGAIWYGSATGAANNAGFTLTNSTLAHNQAVGQGGGLWTSAAATITNVTFYANSTNDPSIADPYDWRRGNGGALAVNNGAAVTITNATFAGNSAGFNGGAIAGPTSVTVRNTIFANNTGANGWKIQQQCTNEFPGAGNLQFPNRSTGNFNDYNCAASAALTIADPQLGALADNGGGTPTLALPPGSPALDSGSAGVCPAADQRGVKRPQGTGCDIGAFELVLALSLVPSLAQAGGPGLTLTVGGAGFSAASKVLWGGTERPTSFVDSTTLRATIAAADLAAVGSINVSVSGSALPAVPFKVVAQLRRLYLPLARR